VKDRQSPNPRLRSGQCPIEHWVLMLAKTQKNILLLGHSHSS